MANITLDELIEKLSDLFTNINNLDKTYYDMFYNTTPMDIVLERYNENGELVKVTIPNRAKDKNSFKMGEGSPEGNVSASLGVFYLDVITKNLYYKGEGTVAEPTPNGWVLFYTEENVGEGLQKTSEKGKPLGYASLDENGKVPADQLPISSLSYIELDEVVTIDVLLKTLLTYTCTNAELVFNNTWTGTDGQLGKRTVELTQQTDSTYTIDTDITTVTGTPTFNNMTGYMTEFSSSNYVTVPVSGAEIEFMSSANMQTKQTILSFGDNKIEFTPSTTTVTVETNREDLVIRNTFEGVEDTTGTIVYTLNYDSQVDWKYNLCSVQGDLVTTTGYISGFSNENYLAPITQWTSTNTLLLKIKTGTDITTPQGIVGNSMSLCIKDGKLGYNSISNEFIELIDITAETNYYFKITYDTAKESNIVQYSTDGETYTTVTPAEADGKFVLNTYVLGKGIVEGVSNTVFLGSIDGFGTGVQTGSVTSYYAESVVGWYRDNANVNVSLSDYDLELVSGEPTIGDRVTATYFTTEPSIGTATVSPSTTYKARYNYNVNTTEYTPQLYLGNEWVNIGAPFESTEHNVDIGKGVFLGAVNLGTSIANKVTLATAKSYTVVGTLTDTDGVVSGTFSNENHVTLPMVTENNSATIHYNLGTLTGKTVLLSAETETSKNIMYIENNKLYVKVGEADAVETTLIDITENTALELKLINANNLWNIQHKLGTATEFTQLMYSEIGDFTPFFIGNTLLIGATTDTSTETVEGSGEATAVYTGFNGTLDFTKSYEVKNDIKQYMYRTETTIVQGGMLLAPLTTIYRWYNEDNTQVNLEDYGLEFVSGIPVTGDKLTLTYTTTITGLAK